MSVFRNAASRAQQQAMGQVIISKPLSIVVLFVGALGIMVTATTFIFNATYTARITAGGSIVSDEGVVRIFSNQGGIVRRRLTKEGEMVNRNQVLFELTSHHKSQSGDGDEFIIAQILSKRNSQLTEFKRIQSVHRHELQELERKIDSLREEVKAIKAQITLQQARVALEEGLFNRASNLAQQGFLASDQVHARKANLLDQQQKLQMLVRDDFAVSRAMDEMSAQKRLLPEKHSIELEQMKRAIASLEQEHSNAVARTGTIVSAPKDGTITAITADVGQSIEPSQPIASIVPSRSRPTAHLYVPSTSVGFLHVGSMVRIRVQAFPYQKYGVIKGSITSIARTTVTASELSSAVKGTALTQPFYLTSVTLEENSAPEIYSQLRPGMQLEADILQETRRLYEWIVDPVTRMSER